MAGVLNGHNASAVLFGRTGAFAALVALAISSDKAGGDALTSCALSGL